VTVEESAAAYTITALVPITEKDDPDRLTGNKLRAAGEDYELAGMTADRYRQYTGPGRRHRAEATAFLEDVLEQSPSALPYDIALTMEQMSGLRSASTTRRT
jgi:hypothetical protein